MSTTATLAAAVPSRASGGTAAFHPWLHGLAVAALAWTFLLISLGGIVTSLDAGMAVPDWPTTFGHSMFGYPLAEMVQDMGVFYEHSHRLAGAGVGFLSIALLLASLLARGASPRIRWGAAGILVLVCLQGVAGGLRVRLDERAVAVFHAVGAQLVLVALVAFALVTSRRWTGGAAPAASPAVRRLRALSGLAVGTLFLHLFAGAGLRHQQVGIQAHLWLAVAVTVLLSAVSVTLLTGFRRTPVLLGHAKRIMGLLGLQIGLGLGAWYFKFGPGLGSHLVELHATLATAHLFAGAALMATVATVALEARWRAVPAQEDA